MRICHVCDTEVEDKEFCPNCTEAIKWYPDPKTMTPEQRLAEFDLWGGPLEVPFDLLHERLEKLIGRSVWTHEFRSTNIEHLRQEIMQDQPLETPEQLEDHLKRSLDSLSEEFPNLKVITFNLDEPDLPCEN